MKSAIRWCPNLMRHRQSRGFVPMITCIALLVVSGAACPSTEIPSRLINVDNVCAARSQSERLVSWISTWIPLSIAMLTSGFVPLTPIGPTAATCFHFAATSTDWTTSISLILSESDPTDKSNGVPAKKDNSPIIAFCAPAEITRGALKLASAKAASEAAFSALAVRSLCFASSVSTRCCAVFASAASFCNPATLPLSFAARSCCCPNSVLAPVKSLSNCRSRSAWRALSRLDVMSTPAPDRKVNPSRITPAISNAVFQDSSDTDHRLNRILEITLYTVSTLLVATVVVVIIILLSHKNLDKS
jgi:hypothetical protein